MKADPDLDPHTLRALADEEHKEALWWEKQARKDDPDPESSFYLAPRRCTSSTRCACFDCLAADAIDRMQVRRDRARYLRHMATRVETARRKIREQMREDRGGGFAILFDEDSP